MSGAAENSDFDRAGVFRLATIALSPSPNSSHQRRHFGTGYHHFADQIGRLRHLAKARWGQPAALRPPVIKMLFAQATPRYA